MKKFFSVVLGIVAIVSVCGAQSLPWQDMGGTVTNGDVGAGGTLGYQPLFSSSQSGSALAEAVTPDIQALARGLQNDPTQIFNYVHDHIRHVFYYGSKKGAELTLLEQSGNDFDQCSLLIALLQAAGYTNTTYQLALIEMPYAASNQMDMQHWIGLTLPNTNWSVTEPFLQTLLYQRGYYLYGDAGDSNTFIFQHVWVALNNGGVTNYLDPSFKISQPISGLSSLSSAMGLNTNTLVTAAGGTETGGYKYQTLNQTALQGALQNCNSNMLVYLSNNLANASVEQIISGQQIVSSAGQPLSTNVLFPLFNDPTDYPLLQWSTIPTAFMSEFQIGIGSSNFTIFTPQLEGGRLSLTFDSNGVAQVWLDDSLQFQTTNTGSGSLVNVTLGVFHPYGGWTGQPVNQPNDTGGAFNIQYTDTYQRTNANYALSYAFEASPNWLQQRERKLDAYRAAGYADSSRQVVTETLNVMGLNWMVQTELSGELLCKQLNILPQYHHRLGRMGQESGNGYYIDVRIELADGFPTTGYQAADVANKNQAFEVGNYFASAAEHGMIEQLQSSGLSAASTTKLLSVANASNQPIYLAVSTNWTSGANIRGSLTNYSSNELSTLDGYISSGDFLLLPQSGAIPVNNWKGSGYVLLNTNPSILTAGLIIGGGYSGGYIGQSNAAVSPQFVASQSVQQPNYTASAPVSVPPSTAGDPVNMSDCSFQVDASDLELGQAEPRGLHFSHHYSSTHRNYNLAGMADGWVHNYYMVALPTSSPLAGMGTTTPAQMVPMVVATCAAANLYNSTQPDPKNWMITAMIAEWGVNCLLSNAVSITFGKDTLQFIKQPDGTYTAPANSTMTYMPNGASFDLQERNGRIFRFNSTGLIANIIDQYTNVYLSFAYVDTNLVSTVTDWKGRSLSFTYTGSPLRLAQVADSTGRTVAFGYTNIYNSQGDLVSFTDAEQQPTTFSYDTNHELVNVTDALSQLVVSNNYDGFGRITTQYTQGNTNRLWQLFWNGFQNAVIDPLGGRQTYFFDAKSREIGFQDALGNTSQYLYDGQDHVVATYSPMGESNQFFYDNQNNLITAYDPIGNSNTFQYDPQNNLTNIFDARGKRLTLAYNTKSQLTTFINGAGDVINNSYSPTDGSLSGYSDSATSATFGYDTYGQLSTMVFTNSLGTNGCLNNALGDVLVSTNARGFTTSFSYNHRRQVISASQSGFYTNTIIYDKIGNVVSNIDAFSNATVNAWSPTRQLLKTTLPTVSGGTPVYTNTYDLRDWFAIAKDALQKPTYYSNDLAGRFLYLIDPLMRTNAFGYDNDGRALTVTDGAMEVTHQQWNSNSELVSLTDPATNTVLNAYDATGNQTILTNRNSKVWQFQYDGANRLYLATSPGTKTYQKVFSHAGLVATNILPATTTTFLYDARDRLTNRTDSIGTTSFRYDPNNNCLGVTEPGNSNTWGFDGLDRVTNYTNIDGSIIQYKYDANDNLTNLIYPGGLTVVYAYDSLNRLTTITDWNNRQTTLNYDLDGRMTNIARPNGTQRIIYYDDAGEATNIIEQTASKAPIAFFASAFDGAGRTKWEFAGPLHHSNSPPSRTITVDADNRLATVNGTAVGMDNNGNLTSGPLTNAAFATYAYDARNRLQGVGGLNYSYDAIDNRIAITNGSSTTTFVMDPNAGLARALLRVQGNVTNYYIYGPGLLYEITVNGTHTNTATYHYDSRGSTVALTDDNANITDQIEYSAYGLTTYRTGTNSTPFLYNGRYGVQTDINGLLYMQARYYNPYLCRFINADPSGFDGGLNWYAYADGNPIDELDPFGLGAITDNSAPSLLAPQNNPLRAAFLAHTCMDCHGNAEVLRIGILPQDTPWFNGRGTITADKIFLGTTAVGSTALVGGPIALSWALGNPYSATMLTVTTAETIAAVESGAPPGPTPSGELAAGVEALETTVFRVEGAPNARILIGNGGQVSVQGEKMLFLNFGERARADQFLAQRLEQGMPGAQLKSFQVPKSFLNNLEKSGVPESMARQFPKSALLVDPTKAPNQFGLRQEQIEELKRVIIQGSGKTH